MLAINGFKLVYYNSLTTTVMAFNSLLIVFTTLIGDVLATKDYLTLILNNETVANNSFIELKENSSMMLQCLADPLNPPRFIALRRLPYLSVVNESSVAFRREDELPCYFNSTMRCDAISHEFKVIATMFVKIDVPCANTMTFYVNDAQIKNGDSVKVSFGSTVNITCISRFPPNPRVLLGVSKDNKLLLLSLHAGVIVHFENVNCNSTATYECVNLNENSPNKTTAEFRLLVDKCYAFLISFDFENLSNSLTTKEKFGDKDKGFFTAYRGLYTHLVCQAQTYFRPIRLIIKSYNGSVLREAENTSRIDLRSDQMECVNNGKMVCELRDHITKGIYSMKIYVWLTSCKPALCHDEADWKLILTNTSKNATVSFCFMFNGMDENITQLALYKNSRLLDISEMKWKYDYEITASYETHVIQNLDFTIVDIDNSDHGDYSINLQFSDGKSIRFRFTIRIEGKETFFIQPDHEEVLSIVLPLIVIIGLLSLTSAVYFTMKKRNTPNNRCKSSDQIVASPNGGAVGSVKYIALKEL